MTDQYDFQPDYHPSGWPVGYRYMCTKCQPPTRWGWRTERLEDHDIAVARLREHHAEEHPMTPEPADPFSVMAAAAVNIHEMYVSLLAAGFTAEHAIYLTAQFTTGGKGTPPATPAGP